MGESTLAKMGSPPAGNVSSSTSSHSRGRVRQALPDAYLGTYQTGPHNGITDVPGVLVNTITIRERDGETNTGVTTILPRRDWFNKACHAGIFRLNGAGEMTGSHRIEETGLLSSPIIISNTFAVGHCHAGVNAYAVQHYGQAGVDWFMLPVVAETFDGFLNDLRHFAVTPEHVFEGIEKASNGPVAEGNTGGGTAMMCQCFKGGTGTSSRVVTGPNGSPSYTVAALVQANFGVMQHLHISGVPIGRILAQQAAKDPEAAARKAEYDAAKDTKDGSIIIILATDLPMHPVQLQRLARRAALGLARTGSYAHNQSGDIFLAFSTAHEVPVQIVRGRNSAFSPYEPRIMDIQVVNDETCNGIFEAAADATEEAIYNALCMAETMTGAGGRTVEALPLDKVREIMARYKEAEKAFT